MSCQALRSRIITHNKSDKLACVREVSDDVQQRTKADRDLPARDGHLQLLY